MALGVAEAVAAFRFRSASRTESRERRRHCAIADFTCHRKLWAEQDAVGDGDDDDDDDAEEAEDGSPAAVGELPRALPANPRE
eukprot:CAMPEP_0118985638 /NCGR_PEP_ID=MMETSP1173-20130426/40447_1 /TAXON_ID=1034831 /ORGANISM="Rhizochromulina marina cf, Strain CCMP1243" /LENGTH=82 /DNA_ID=CAMNT_0006936373 /DNA_START=30 /DNA_END=275 /DNA_ORIENTATION=+